jgi:predicted enzyme related to lactoylglutathione lyase
MRLIQILVLAAALASSPVGARAGTSEAPPGVGPQYDSTHVYVAPQDFDKFVASLTATFGGSTSKQVLVQVTPTPSQTLSQIVLTPVGIFSVFGFTTPIPWPFGSERTGYLVADIDAAVRAAQANGADLIVETFPDPIGRDAIVAWPGGLRMQLYWHTNAPSYPSLRNIPENRVYVSAGAADAFIKSFVAFSHGAVLDDAPNAPGLEIGRPGETYRRVRIESPFGKMVVLATDGHLPYPYGRETTGYEVADLAGVLGKAEGAGATVLVPTYEAGGRRAAIVEFPGGYIAELHSSAGR